MATLPHTFEVSGGQPVTIYAEPDNINYFLRNALTPDTLGEVTNVQSSVSAHTRQQYPGDPTPQNVASGSRVTMVDPSRKSGTGLPGRSFVLAALDGTGAIVEKRQFTYKGRWLDLHVFLRAEAAFDLYAYNNTGARYSIADSTPE